MPVPGHVIHVRINPTDELTALALVEKAMGIDTTRMSFAQVAKIAFSGLLQMARETKLVEMYSGFEYNDRIQDRFYSEANNPRARGFKARATKAFQDRMEGKAEPLFAGMLTGASDPDSAGSSSSTLSVPMQITKARHDELLFRFTQDPDNFDKIDLAELRRLADILEPRK